jgi:hypothetical protein
MLWADGAYEIPAGFGEYRARSSRGIFQQELKFGFRRKGSRNSYAKSNATLQGMRCFVFHAIGGNVE